MHIGKSVRVFQCFRGLYDSRTRNLENVACESSRQKQCWAMMNACGEWETIQEIGCSSNGAETNQIQIKEDTSETQKAPQKNQKLKKKKKLMSIAKAKKTWYMVDVLTAM